MVYVVLGIRPGVLYKLGRYSYQLGHNPRLQHASLPFHFQRDVCPQTILRCLPYAADVGRPLPRLLRGSFHTEVRLPSFPCLRRFQLSDGVCSLLFLYSPMGSLLSTCCWPVCSRKKGATRNGAKGSRTCNSGQ